MDIWRLRVSAGACAALLASLLALGFSLLAGPTPDGGERYLVQVACVVALVWIFSRALFSGLHAQEKPTKSDEHYALWAEKYILAHYSSPPVLPQLTCFLPVLPLSPNRLSTAMPRILVLVLLLISSYHFLLSLANSLLRVVGA